METGGILLSRTRFSVAPNTRPVVGYGHTKPSYNTFYQEKFSLNWTGPFKNVAVGPSPAANQLDRRPLEDKLLYLDLPSDLSGLAFKPHVTVARRPSPPG